MSIRLPPQPLGRRTSLAHTFFSPANVMRLLEIVRGRQTSNDVLATVMQLAKRLKKVGVVSRRV